ncbi:Nif3-like dinuclear metal center hexameric protein [Fusobacterium russii]|uniref:Nif3-like dinuclear metal center hexameric protein n=1 Tax=Fusobacterium russii TaxID=854 RepID=UPI0003A6022E|nr:Nif3-like dinuclear metal center hexameric protein [Fusobacterium russii]
MRAKDIIKVIEEKFPLVNAEDWDNVGLLVGDINKEIKKIQFSIDATVEAIENAIKLNVDMIITHHPIIFKAIKSIREQETLGKKLRKLIKNDINVYCIHTNLDSTKNGLNDWVLKKIGIEESKILDLNEEKGSGIGRLYTLEEETKLINYIQKLKKDLSIRDLRVISKNLDKNVRKVALINGSAMSYWRLAKAKNVDLFITGDIGYHDALDALENGLSVIDFGHYESENFFDELLKKELNSLDLEFFVFNDGPVFNFL